MVKEFQAIQRFKEEELVAQQLNQAAPNELEAMINDAANPDETEAAVSSLLTEERPGTNSKN